MSHIRAAKEKSLQTLCDTHKDVAVSRVGIRAYCRSINADRMLPLLRGV